MIAANAPAAGGGVVMRYITMRAPEALMKSRTSSSLSQLVNVFAVEGVMKFG